MSNLEKMIKFARDKKAADFTNTFKAELSNRVSAKLDSMKSAVSKSLFRNEK